MIMFLSFCTFVLAASFLLTGVLRRYAITRSLIDVPNARSSHSVPTPRGGGVAIVVSFLISLIFVAYYGLIGWPLAIALLGSGSGIALLGFLDDHGHIPARWRLLGHLMSAVWALYWLGGMPSVVLFTVEADLGLFGYILAIIYLIWMLNLYNFMDGIDGIASVEAVCACLGACLLFWLAGFEELIAAPIVLAMSVAGFLCWNFPPAKIFMGDAGSGFLGITLGVLSLQAAWTSPKLLWVWLILLGIFVVDATVTLLRRLVRGDKVYEAHRSHAYQYASRQLGRHLPVTLAVGAINVLWLWPMAASVVFWDLDGTLALFVSYAPLVLLAIKFHAGELEKN